MADKRRGVFCVAVIVSVLGQGNGKGATFDNFTALKQEWVNCGYPPAETYNETLSTNSFSKCLDDKAGGRVKKICELYQQEVDRLCHTSDPTELMQTASATKEMLRAKLHICATAERVQLSPKIEEHLNGLRCAHDCSILQAADVCQLLILLCITGPDSFFEVIPTYDPATMPLSTVQTTTTTAAATTATPAPTVTQKSTPNEPTADPTATTTAPPTATRTADPTATTTAPPTATRTADPTATTTAPPTTTRTAGPTVNTTAAPTATTTAAQVVLQTTKGSDTEDVTISSTGSYTEDLTTTSTGSGTEDLTTTSTGSDTENLTTTTTGSDTDDLTTTSTGSGTEDLTTTTTGSGTEDLTTTTTGSDTENLTTTTTGSDTEDLTTTTSESDTEDLTTTSTGSDTEDLTNSAGSDHGQIKEEPDVTSSGHFMAFFIPACVLAIAAYVVYSNRKKIIAVIVEGRSSRWRRSNDRGKYKILQNDVEEVLSSTSATNFIY